jgi:hypothetical protein
MTKTFIGKPCRSCGGTERYLSGNKGCVACAKENSKRRVAASAEWKRENKDRVNKNNRLRYNSLSPEEKKERMRRQQMALYGLTLEDYDNMLQEQGGVCACCGKPELKEGRTNLCVDHNHETGKVRALLCDYCNRGIGYFTDNIDKLRNCVLYLEKYDGGG